MNSSAVTYEADYATTDQGMWRLTAFGDEPSQQSTYFRAATLDLLIDCVFDWIATSETRNP